jgi:hypothetical protein
MIILLDEPEAIDMLEKTKLSQVGLNVRQVLPNERKNARQREYVARNKDVIYERQKPYCEKYAQSEKAKATRAAWREKNREKIREYDNARNKLK